LDEVWAFGGKPQSWSGDGSRKTLNTSGLPSWQEPYPEIDFGERRPARKARLARKDKQLPAGHRAQLHVLDGRNRFTLKSFSGIAGLLIGPVLPPKDFPMGASEAVP
jgi:hypothetical protein